MRVHKIDVVILKIQDECHSLFITVKMLHDQNDYLVFRKLRFHILESVMYNIYIINIADYM